MGPKQDVYTFWIKVKMDQSDTMPLLFLLHIIWQSKFDILYESFFFLWKYSQKDFTCDYWYNVDCSATPHYYNLNADPETNPYTGPQIKKEREEAAKALHHSYYWFFMRFSVLSQFFVLRLFSMK